MICHLFRYNFLVRQRQPDRQVSRRSVLHCYTHHQAGFSLASVSCNYNGGAALDEFLYCLCGLFVRDICICTDNLKHGMKIIVNSKEVFNSRIVAGNLCICDIAGSNYRSNMIDFFAGQSCFYLRNCFQYLWQIGQSLRSYFQMVLNQNIVYPR